MNYKLKNGIKIEVREALVSDEQQLLEYIQKVNSETKNLSRDPHEFTMTLEQEESFLKRVTNSEHEAMFVVFHDNKLIASAGIHGSSLNRLKHRVNLGISVLQEYNNLGVGSVLMAENIKKARLLKKHKIELEVRDDNPGAIHLYEKFGFVSEGIIKDGFYVDNTFVDLRQMGLLLEE